MDFWTIIQIGIYVLLAAAVLLVLWFIYNTGHSLGYSSKASKAMKAMSLNSHLPEWERLAQLPTLPMPVSSFSRAHGRIPFDEVPNGNVGTLIDIFSEYVFKANNPKLFLAQLPAVKDSSTSYRSFAVGLQATSYTRFLGWITVERFGTHYEWHLMCAEIRAFWTPPELDSHFEYGPEQEARQERRAKEMDAGFWIFLSTGLFAGHMTPEKAKDAAWFERFMKEMWDEALYLASGKNILATVNAASEKGDSTPQTIAIPSQEPPQRRRPSRRD